MLQQGFCQDQVADDFPRTGQQENQIATFLDPDMEEVWDYLKTDKICIW